jgi:hypothetical protein
MWFIFKSLIILFYNLYLCYFYCITNLRFRLFLKCITRIYLNFEKKSSYSLHCKRTYKIVLMEQGYRLDLPPTCKLREHTNISCHFIAKFTARILKLQTRSSGKRSRGRSPSPYGIYGVHIFVGFFPKGSFLSLPICGLYTENDLYLVS